MFLCVLVIFSLVADYLGCPCPLVLAQWNLCRCDLHYTFLFGEYGFRVLGRPGDMLWHEFGC
jgi:hypothetical protein